MQSNSNWHTFWNTFPSRFKEDEFALQVGKTFHGQPVTERQVDGIVSCVRGRLAIAPDDDVLDLCCGNGLITSKIARACKRIVGVDFSAPLIETARKFHMPPNARYLNQSVLGLTREDTGFAGGAAKIYMYEALQHFKVEDLAAVLDMVLRLSAPSVRAFFASIPDKERLWDFYSTPELKELYLRKTQEGELLLGTWWEKSFIRDACAARGLRCQFLDQPAGFHTAHYRFDLLITND